MICPICGQTQTVGLAWIGITPRVYYVCIPDGWKPITDPIESNAAITLFNAGEAFQEATTWEKFLFSIKQYFTPAPTPP
jgi:hypothetical protein